MSKIGYTGFEPDFVAGGEKTFSYTGDSMGSLDTKGIITLLVAAAVTIAFVFTVIAPSFGLPVAPATATAVFGLFTVLAGGGSASQLLSMGQAQAQKAATMASIQSKFNSTLNTPQV